MRFFYKTPKKAIYDISWNGIFLGVISIKKSKSENGIKKRICQFDEQRDKCGLVKNTARLIHSNIRVL